MRQTQLVPFLIFLFTCSWLQAQEIKGHIHSALDGEPLIGASILIEGSTNGTVTDFDGNFRLEIPTFPVRLVVNYIGFEEQILTLDQVPANLVITMEESGITLESVQVQGHRITDKQKETPLTVEALDLLAIKETPSDNFYDGLGSLKGVDLTAASLGFKVVNMRGFNSTSPVRSLQIIDGVDNQAPGLNFSLGNFLGSSELDVRKVELVAGASGPFYGPNAFNGVISMETKSPFFFQGLSAQLKTGERQLFESAIRWAQAFNNRDNEPLWAYKLNFYYLKAYDWEADNYDPVNDSEYDASNPGGYDAVNIYGDEYKAFMDYTGDSEWSPFYPLGAFFRKGYKEIDLVDYNTRNIKANAAVHIRLDPKQDFDSPELILASSFGSGTTVYQGDNRFSLKNILFFQNRIEIQKKDKYFIRAYATNEDAGDSYDPYFTALKLQQNAKSDVAFRDDYRNYWTGIGKFSTRMVNELGYPKLVVSYDTMTMKLITSFDSEAAENWFVQYADSMMAWHARAQAYANQTSNLPGVVSVPFYVPGTIRFQEEFDRIRSTKSGDQGGTLFFDKSALYHIHGQYQFDPIWFDKIVVGGNYRLYKPNSEGTIFVDTLVTEYNDQGQAVNSYYNEVTNEEFGFYGGVEKKFFGQLTTAATLRVDKNKNFDWLFTPALSAVYSPMADNYLRLSFSSAIRNPTLTDQYLRLNVGPALLVGNLMGFDSLITIESFRKALDNPTAIAVDSFVYFNAPPIRPEKVKTFEIGYRTTLLKKIYIDAGYYFNIYDDFIGYNIGLTVPVKNKQVSVKDLQVYRVSANSTKQVQTHGFNIGINYYMHANYMVSGNYSWNKLLKTDENDPIIPAFNTPEHKFNISFSARDLRLSRRLRTGFSMNYKWVEGFLFEGSPQFTGEIPTYDMVDVQWNVRHTVWGTTLKIGASNLFGFTPLNEPNPDGKSAIARMFDNRNFQTYGGPRIGRLAYISLLYELDTK
ncbi:MAG: TonB-dependent receptor [Saprospiraceae bacterium]|nr:TonB-dependent receptor [Saprospiraceae bacterium]